MSIRRLLILVAAWMAMDAWSGANAQNSPPAPSALVDQAQADSRLTGIAAKEGLKLEVVAEGVATRLPLAIGFGEKGTILILTAGTAASPEQLVSLADTDADGRCEKSEVVMSDLSGRTSLLVDGGWYYLAGGGTVVRRHRHDPELAARLEAAAEAKSGPPTKVAPDKRWLQQTLIQGLSNKGADQTGGLALGLDGSIYLAVGGTANRAESWDGSKAAVLGSGAILRFQPDGSRLQEYTGGFAAPTGPPVHDAFGTWIQADKTPSGSRIIHVLEGADYGWRADLDPPQLDRPGTLPAMATGPSSPPNSLLVCQGAAFPAPLQGQLLSINPSERIVQASILERADNSFAVRQPTTLIRGDRTKFSPHLLAQGPEGAIYVVDMRGGDTRILRLTWSGTTAAPAIDTPVLAKYEPPAPPDLAENLALAQDKTKPAALRAAALGRACRQWDRTVLDACLGLLEDENVDLARLAADALGDHLPDDAEMQQRIADTMQQKLLHAPLPVRRSLYIALGKLGTKLDTVPEWVFEATSVTPDVHTNRYLFEAHVRAAEMPKGWATELLIGNLEVALFDPNPEPQERDRLKKFVTVTAEQMRTRELAGFLDKSIKDERDYFSKLDAPLQVRLLAAYQNVLVDPPINSDAVAQWLAKHSSPSPEVLQAAWQTLGKVGTSKPELTTDLVKPLVASGKLDPTLKASVIAALERHRDPAKRGEIDALIESVKKVQ